MPETNSPLSKNHIFAVLAGMYCTVDSKGIIIRAEGAWERILGTSPDELVGSHILERVHHEDISHTEKILTHLLRKRASTSKDTIRKYRLRNRMRHANGSFAQVLWSAAVPPDQDIVFLAAHTPNRIETELRLAKTLIDALPLRITMESREGVLLYDNKEKRGSNTIADEEPSSEFSPPASEAAPNTKTAKYQEIINQLHQNGAHGTWSGETTARNPDGTSFPVQRTLVALNPDDGAPGAIACIERDIRELNHERMLAKQLQMLVATTSDLIATANFKGITSYVNPAGMALLGRAGEDFTHLRLSDILPPHYLKMFVEHVFPKVRAEGLWQGDTEILRKDGSAFAVSQVVLLTHDRHGIPTGYGTIAKDLRGRIALEKSLKKTLRSLSSPILRLGNGILAMPVIGDVDDTRASRMTEALLRALIQYKCQLFIVDFTGIQGAGPSLMPRFAGMFCAAKWLGAQAWMSGVPPQMARSIAGLHEDLPELRAFATLRDALFAARSLQKNDSRGSKPLHRK